MEKRKLNLKIDKELLITFLLVFIVGIIYYFVRNQKAFLNFFYLPVLLGAFFFGKKHGTTSAILSVLMIILMAYFIPESFLKNEQNNSLNKWLDITIWGSFLILTGYSMGFLYEKKEKFTNELNSTYRGIITMLSIVIDSVDKYTQNHAYRVSKYSEMIARESGLQEKEIDDIRTAALLHDIGKIGVSEKILNKIDTLTDSERKEMNSHTAKAEDFLAPVGGKILKILPLIVNHHERYDGNGYNSMAENSIPVGARIIAVADVYDALTTDRPYRKALSPIEGKNEIINGAGTHFDPEIVKCFERVFPEFLKQENYPQFDVA